MNKNSVTIALDFICNLAISGVGGLVLVTCNNPSAISSTNEQNACFIARRALLLEPATPAECLAMTRFAFELSKAIGNLVVLLSVSRLSHTRAGGVTPGELPVSRLQLAWNLKVLWLTVPVVPRHQVMLDKLAKMRSNMASQRLQPL
jgi:indolepyruvate ferredoxin oxidoreductase alpha subunit